MERHVTLTDEALAVLVTHAIADVDTSSQPAKYRDLLEGLAVAACAYLGWVFVRVEKHPKGGWRAVISLNDGDDLKG